MNRELVDWSRITEIASSCTDKRETKASQMPASKFPEIAMTTPTAPRMTATGRLGNGELRRQIAAWLDAHPGAHTPGTIAKALDRSSGAVGNALTTLAMRSQAELVPGKPARYQATPATRAAADGISAAPAPRARAAHRPAAPAVPPAPKAAPAPGPVTRPNGAVYRPRALADMPDTDALRRLRAAGIPALLYGPPGTGKTSLVEAAFAGEVITVAGDGDTTTGDLVGDYTQRADGAYEFVYGPLVTAMAEGKVLFIDDCTLISPAVLAVAYPAMDGRGTITVKACKGETITAAPGFWVIGGHNPNVHGAILTEALASRFTVQVRVGTDYDLARSLKIDPRAITAATDLAGRQARGEIGWSPQLRELIGYQRTAAALGPDAAAANLAGIAPAEDQDAVADALRRAFGRTITPLALGHQI
jgi:nitric oxide reductase NorQ protein